MLESIKRSPLFRGLTEEECAAVGASGQRRRLAKGEILYFQGSEVETIFLTIDGVIQVSRWGPDGSSVILRVARAGDVLGANEWISDVVHNTSAIATHPSRVLAWERADFRRLTVRHAVLEGNALQIALVHLEELEERFWEAVTQKAELRIARQLIRLWRQSGSTLTLSVEQLSLMTGTTIYTVSRVLSRWSVAGLICRGPKSTIEIVGRDALVRVGEPKPGFVAPTSRQQ